MSHLPIVRWFAAVLLVLSVGAVSVRGQNATEEQVGVAEDPQRQGYVAKNDTPLPPSHIGPESQAEHQQYINQLPQAYQQKASDLLAKSIQLAGEVTELADKIFELIEKMRKLNRTEDQAAYDALMEQVKKLSRDRGEKQAHANKAKRDYRAALAKARAAVSHMQNQANRRQPPTDHRGTGGGQTPGRTSTPRQGGTTATSDSGRRGGTTPDRRRRDGARTDESSGTVLEGGVTAERRITAQDLVGLEATAKQLENVTNKMADRARKYHGSGVVPLKALQARLARDESLCRMEHQARDLRQRLRGYEEKVHGVLLDPSFNPQHLPPEVSRHLYSEPMQEALRSEKHPDIVGRMVWGGPEDLPGGAELVAQRGRYDRSGARRDRRAPERPDRGQRQRGSRPSRDPRSGRKSDGRQIPLPEGEPAKESVFKLSVRQDVTMRRVGVPGADPRLNYALGFTDQIRYEEEQWLKDKLTSGVYYDLAMEILLRKYKTAKAGVIAWQLANTPGRLEELKQMAEQGGLEWDDMTPYERGAFTAEVVKYAVDLGVDLKDIAKDADELRRGGGGAGDDIERGTDDEPPMVGRRRGGDGDQTDQPPTAGRRPSDGTGEDGLPPIRTQPYPYPRRPGDPPHVEGDAPARRDVEGVVLPRPAPGDGELPPGGRGRPPGDGDGPAGGGRHDGGGDGEGPLGGGPRGGDDEPVNPYPDIRGGVVELQPSRSRIYPGHEPPGPHAQPLPQLPLQAGVTHEEIESYHAGAHAAAEALDRPIDDANGVWDQTVINSGYIYDHPTEPRVYDTTLRQRIAEFENDRTKQWFRDLDLRGMTPEQVHRRMLELGAMHSRETLIKLDPNNVRVRVPHDIYRWPGGLMVRSKPEGAPHDRFRPQAHVSKSVLFDTTPNDEGRLRGYARDTSFFNEGFKVTNTGQIVPAATMASKGARQVSGDAAYQAGFHDHTMGRAHTDLPPEVAGGPPATGADTD